MQEKGCVQQLVDVQGVANQQLALLLLMGQFFIKYFLPLRKVNTQECLFCHQQVYFLCLLCCLLLIPDKPIKMGAENMI